MEAYPSASLQSSLFNIYYFAILFIGIGNNTMERRRWRKAARIACVGSVWWCAAKMFCLRQQDHVYILESTGSEECGWLVSVWPVVSVLCLLQVNPKDWHGLPLGSNLPPPSTEPQGTKVFFSSSYTPISLCVSSLSSPGKRFPFSLLRLIHPCLFYLFI